MQRWLAVPLLSVFIPVAVESQIPAPTQSRPIPQIVTTAVGEARVPPDRATLIVAVETRASTAAQAGAENARRQKAVLDTLRKLGLSQDQLSTTGYSVHPEMRYEENRSRVVGYVARNMVQADLRRIDQVGSLIDAALGAGANVVNSLRFYSSRENEARQSALANAVQKARADAEAMARAAGGTLGPLLELSTAGPVRPMYEEVAMMARATADAPPTPINPGEQEVSVMVSAKWTFVPGSQ